MIRELNQLKQLKHRSLLIYGIGNVGRQDDGLGIRLIENLEDVELPDNIDLQSNYQLNIEDALEISNYDVVLFIDASKLANARAPFEISEIYPSIEIAFSTHAMTMQAILGLADQLYGKRPKAFLFTIPGYYWEIKDQLSEQATCNLKLTTQALKKCLGFA